MLYFCVGQNIEQMTNFSFPCKYCQCEYYTLFFLIIPAASSSSETAQSSLNWLRTLHHCTAIKLWVLPCFHGLPWDWVGHTEIRKGRKRDFCCRTGPIRRPSRHKRPNSSFVLPYPHCLRNYIKHAVDFSEIIPGIDLTQNLQGAQHRCVAQFLQ